MATRDDAFVALAREILLPCRLFGYYGFECWPARDVRPRREPTTPSSSPQTSQARSRLLGGLPRELLWMITGYLDEGDLAALALTCKPAHHAWFTLELRQHMQAGCHHSRRLLEGLSRDLHAASAKSWNFWKRKTRLPAYDPGTRRLVPCACRRCRTPRQAREQLLTALGITFELWPVLRAVLDHTLIFSGDDIPGRRQMCPEPFLVVIDYDFNRCCVVDPTPYPEPSLEDVSPMLAGGLRFLNVLCVVLRWALGQLVRAKSFAAGSAVYCSWLIGLLIWMVLLLLLIALYLMMQVYTALIVAALIVHVLSGCWQGFALLF